MERDNPTKPWFRYVLCGFAGAALFYFAWILLQLLIVWWIRGPEGDFLNTDENSLPSFEASPAESVD